jgi:hypothetical protein
VLDVNTRQEHEMSLKDQTDAIEAQVHQAAVISLDDSEIEVSPTQGESRPVSAQRSDDSWAANSDNQQNFQNN